MNDLKKQLREAAEWIIMSSRTAAFTGAGISVESGIPPFRGKDGLWAKYDPGFLDIDYFHMDPAGSWKVIKEIFYDFFGRAEPNAAHFALAEMEKRNLLQVVITQNIDNLHQEAGSRNVLEFHGNSRNLVCLKCGQKYPAPEMDLSYLPPRCLQCNEPLKPDFIFFGEPIPEPARSRSFDETSGSEVFILIGTTGEIMPASLIPFEAKRKGKKIIEVNTTPSNYTGEITDIFLEGRASRIVPALLEALSEQND